MYKFRYKKTNEIREAYKIEKKVHIIAIVPEKYQYPRALSYLIDVVDSGRADTLKEALNMYEEHLHIWRLDVKRHKSLKGEITENNDILNLIKTEKLL